MATDSRTALADRAAESQATDQEPPDVRTVRSVGDNPALPDKAFADSRVDNQADSRVEQPACHNLAAFAGDMAEDRAALEQAAAVQHLPVVSSAPLGLESELAVFPRREPPP